MVRCGYYASIGKSAYMNFSVFKCWGHNKATMTENLPKAPSRPKSYSRPSGFRKASFLAEVISPCLLNMEIWISTEEKVSRKWPHPRAFAIDPSRLTQRIRYRNRRWRDLCSTSTLRWSSSRPSCCHPWSTKACDESPSWECEWPSS